MTIFLNDDDTNSEIFIPPVACNFRNNCQDGSWFFDNQEVGRSGSEFLIFAFSPYFGDLGATQDTHWGQIWGYPLSAGFPPLVFVTYIKTSGLQSFCNQWNWIKSQDELDETGQPIILPNGKNQKKNPSRFVWRAQFKKDVKALPDGTKGNYYLLLWETEELAKTSERHKLAEKCERDMRENITRLVDNQGTAKLISTLGMSENEKAAAIANFKAQKEKQLAPAAK